MYNSKPPTSASIPEATNAIGSLFQERVVDITTQRDAPQVCGDKGEGEKVVSRKYEGLDDSSPEPPLSASQVQAKEMRRLRVQLKLQHLRRKTPNLKTKKTKAKLHQGVGCPKGEKKRSRPSDESCADAPVADVEQWAKCADCCQWMAPLEVPTSRKKGAHPHKHRAEKDGDDVAPKVDSKHDVAYACSLCGAKVTDTFPLLSHIYLYVHLYLSTIMYTCIYLRLCTLVFIYNYEPLYVHLYISTRIALMAEDVNVDSTENHSCSSISLTSCLVAANVESVVQSVKSLFLPQKLKTV
jgi:hypothetical protein